MDNTMQHQSSTRNSAHHNYVQSSSAKTNVLKGIELDLFSYQLNEDDFVKKLREACGTHFMCELVSNDEKHSTYYITPHEYSLVNGGMLYKSAGNIVSKLSDKGILIAGMREVIK